MATDIVPGNSEAAAELAEQAGRLDAMTALLAVAPKQFEALTAGQRADYLAAMADLSADVLDRAQAAHIAIGSAE